MCIITQKALRVPAKRWTVVQDLDSIPAAGLAEGLYNLHLLTGDSVGLYGSVYLLLDLVTRLGRVILGVGSPFGVTDSGGSSGKGGGRQRNAR